MDPPPGLAGGWVHCLFITMKYIKFAIRITKKMNIAICYNPFIPMRAEPSGKSEMVSQVLFGEQMEILKVDTLNGFTLIRNMFDNYEGWCENKVVKKADPEFLAQIAERRGKQTFTRYQKMVCTEVFTQLISHDRSSFYYLSAGSDLFFNSEMTINILGVPYIMPEELAKSEIISSDQKIIRSAQKLLNIPYLWGGRSSWGIDCSGFVQNVYKQAGIALPRDASQQAKVGTSIDFINDSIAGDILFFDNKEGEIIHTGIYLGGGTIIHASGKVRKDSIDHQGIFNLEENKYTHSLRIIKRIIPPSPLS
jgi:gamma-D-glutamyl-L-lysine dipeptidyl-peptidase